MQEDSNKKLLSVVIPAYNKPEYLKRCLDSILLQTYRPIEIVISDDQSPTSLEPVINEFRSKIDAQITIKQLKPAINLRPYHNGYYALSHATGLYAVTVPHDDWFIDSNFFSEGIYQLESNEKCFISIANSILEDTKIPMMSAKGFNKWTYLEGREFVSSRLYDDMHPCYSGILFNLKKLLELGSENFFITKESSIRMGLEPDEGFLMIHLLATSGYVAITSKNVCIRGTPPDSYSKSDFWTKHVNLGLFIVNVRLHNYYMKKGYLECALLMKRLLVKWPLHHYNSEVIRYLDNDKTAIIYMCLGVIKNQKFIRIVKENRNKFLPINVLKSFLKLVLPRRWIIVLKNLVNVNNRST